MRVLKEKRLGGRGKKESSKGTNFRPFSVLKEKFGAIPGKMGPHLDKRIKD